MTPLRLSECGDTLRVSEICRVLQIGRSHYYELVRHRAFPIKPIMGLGVTRYANVTIAQFLASGRALTSVRPKANPSQLKQQFNQRLNGTR